MKNTRTSKKILKIVVTGKLLKHINILSSNGLVRLTSETYYSKGNAMRAANDLARETGWKVEDKI